MSNRHKLYGLEVTPPQGAWDRIAEELDNIKTYAPLADKLSAAAIPPPPAVWEQLNEQLEDESLYQAIAEKLQDAAIQPPAAVWTALENRLNNTKGKVVMVPRRGFGWKQLAIAASIAGLLGYTGYFFIGHPNNKNAGTVALAQPPAKEQHSPAADSAKNETLAMNTPVLPEPQEDPQQPLVNNTIDAGTHIKTKLGNAYGTTEEKDEALQGRYIVLMTENGEVVRMSKKLGGMADCVAGADNSTECSKQIRNWQKEMASLPLASTPDNILDILSLANQETKQD